MAVASSVVSKIPESVYTYKMEFPVIFDQLVQAARERGLIPFLRVWSISRSGTGERILELAI
jgi:hypothetical protein